MILKSSTYTAIIAKLDIDILIKYCVALTKVILGRIRTRFSQSNALWTQDGDKILEEGNTELKELREVLRVNSNLIMLID